MKIYLDTETCAFTGPVVLIQYALGPEGKVYLHHPWDVPAKHTLTLIETFCDNEVVTWNLTYDWFHLQRLYCLFSTLDPDAIPREHIEYLQKQDPNIWRLTDYCIKPKAALDLFLYAKTGPLQMVMDRKDIVVRKIPALLASVVCDELNERTELPDLLFAKKVDPTIRWTYQTHEKDPQFCDIVLRFAPSARLKDVIAYLNLADTTKFEEVMLSKNLNPSEESWNPLATKWAFYLPFHLNHWGVNQLAQSYAYDDVRFLQMIDAYFGFPDAGDINSEIAVQVACTRFFGFAVDKEELQSRIPALKTAELKAPTAPGRVKDYIYPLLSETELLALDGSTKKEILEDMVNWTVPCISCDSEGCSKCDMGMLPHPVVKRVEEVLAARRAGKRRELIEKLLTANRFHASYNVIGTLSSRMSGTDGINPQGIPKKKIERKPFTLADGDFILSGGDFDAFEVSIACAAYEDPVLEEELKSGKKIHVLFAQMMFPDVSYEEIVASDKTDNDMYAKGKAGVFGDMYGGTYETLMNRLGLEEEHAIETTENWRRKYQGAGRYRDEMHDRFASMKQPKGIGTKIEWHDPDEYVESLNGFRRYYTYENQMCKILFELANKPPKRWMSAKQQVIRRDREQTASGAARSAVFAAAFNIQAKNLRAAINHVIQSTGALITKEAQKEIWDLQPAGVHPLQVKLMNIHDELLAVHRPELTEKVQNIVENVVERNQEIVPLLQITWETDLPCWGYGD